MKKSLLIILIFIVLPSVSFGQTNACDGFKTGAVGIIQRARANGWKKIDSTSLLDLETTVQNSNFELNCTQSVEQTDGRVSAHFQNLNGAKKIFVSSPQIENSFPAVISTLALHEIISVEGIPDSNYQKSLRLALMSVTPRTGAGGFAKSLEFSDTASRKGNGGATGVGGGGDLADLFLRSLLLGVVKDANWKKGIFAGDGGKQNYIDAVLNLQIIYTSDPSQKPTMDSYYDEASEHIDFALVVSDSYKKPEAIFKTEFLDEFWFVLNVKQLCRPESGGKRTTYMFCFMWDNPPSEGDKEISRALHIPFPGYSPYGFRLKAPEDKSGM